jgi:hypothetical protein
MSAGDGAYSGTERSDSMLTTLVAVVALAGAAQSVVSVPFRTIARGADSKIGTRHELVVRTAGSWHLIWYKHHGPSETPAIDFRREMILAIFAGNRAMRTSSIEIVSVTREADSLVIRYRVRRDRTAAAPPIATAPFHIIAVPADRALVRFVEVPD